MEFITVRLLGCEESIRIDPDTSAEALMALEMEEGAAITGSTESDSDHRVHGPVGWWQRPALSDADRMDFIALRRVCGREGSSVDRVGECYYDGERPLLPFVEKRVIALIEAGYARVDVPDSSRGDRQRVVVTASGRARYEQLCDRQGIAAYPLPATEDTSPPRAGRSSGHTCSPCHLSDVQIDDT